MNKYKYIVGLIVGLIIAGGFTVYAATPVTFPVNGGLGTSTKPTNGQVPTGDGSGIYTPQAAFATTSSTYWLQGQTANLNVGVLTATSTATSSFQGPVQLGSGAGNIIFGTNALTNAGFGTTAPYTAVGVSGTVTATSFTSTSTLNCAGSQALTTNSFGNIVCGTFGGASLSGGVVSTSTATSTFLGPIEAPYIAGWVGIEGNHFIATGTANNVFKNHLVIGSGTGISSKSLTIGDTSGGSSIAGADGIAIQLNGGGGLYVKDVGNNCEGKYEVYAGAMGVGTMSNCDLGIYTGNATRMTFKANTGLIGIGTTSPYLQLSVEGSSDLGKTALAGNFYATSTNSNTFNGNLVVNGTATSTFAGAISDSGWTFATSTVVCFYPEHCTYQINRNSTSTQTVINLAMANVSAAGGGDVFLKLLGTSTVSDVIKIPSNINLHGLGMGQTVIKADVQYNPSTTCPDAGRCMVINANGTSVTANNINIYDITWDGNGPNIVGANDSGGINRMFDFFNGQNIHVFRNSFLNAINWTVYFRGVDGLWIQDNICHSGWSTTYTQNDCLHVRNSTHVFITHNYSNTNGPGTSGDDAIVVVADSFSPTYMDMTDAVIADNTIQSQGRGIAVIQSSNANLKGIDVHDNIIEYGKKTGILIQKIGTDDNGITQGINIHDNHVLSYGQGGADGDGIRAEQTNSPRIISWRDIQIHHNEVANSGYTGGSAIAVFSKGERPDVSFNHIYNFTGVKGIAFGGTSEPIFDGTVLGNIIDVSSSTQNVVGIYAQGTQRFTYANNLIIGTTTGTTYGIELLAKATAGNDSDGFPNAETSTDNTLDTNHITNFDNGVAEVNNGTAPIGNHFNWTTFNGVTTRYTILSASTQSLGDGGLTLSFATSTGYIGIGTASPQNALDVYGTFTSRSGADYFGHSQDGINGNLNSSNTILLKLQNVTWASLIANGNFGIGSTSPVAKLGVGGEVQAAYFTATTTATSTFGGPITVMGSTTASNFTVTSTSTPVISVASTTGNANQQVSRSTAVLSFYGVRNVFLGNQAGEIMGISSATGLANTFVGNRAGRFNTTASSNTGIGDNSLISVNSGGSNSALGQNTLGSATTGTFNVAFGVNSGSTFGSNLGVSTASFNTFVGANSGTNNASAAVEKSICIGFGCSVKVSNAGVLGSTDNTLVAVGSTSPTFAVFSVTSTSTASTTIAAIPASGQTANIFSIFNTSGTLTDVITANNSWGLGSTSVGALAKLAVNGRVYLTGLTTSSGTQSADLCANAAGEVISDSVACIVSARRYKTDIQKLTPGLDEILKLQAVSFFYKPDFNGALQSNPNYSGLQYSLIADDVQKIDPRLVSVTVATTSFEGITYPAGTVQGLSNFNHWVALFVNGFKDVETKIQALIARVSGDEGRISKLEKQNQDLQKRLDILEKKVK